MRFSALFAAILLAFSVSACSRSHLQPGEEDWVAPPKDDSGAGTTEDGGFEDGGVVPDGSVSVDASVVDSAVIDSAVVDSAVVDSAVVDAAMCVEFFEPSDIADGIRVESVDFSFGCIPTTTEFSMNLSPNLFNATKLTLAFNDWPQVGQIVQGTLTLDSPVFPPQNVRVRIQEFQQDGRGQLAFAFVLLTDEGNLPLQGQICDFAGFPAC